MAIPLSSDLQHALHAGQDELEVVDPSTGRRYVIVAKDQWLARAEALQSSGRESKIDGGESGSVESWTDEKNRRRAELVDLEICGSLTHEEWIELEILQRQMRAYRYKVAPLPLDDTRRLHAELMEKARQAHTERQ